MLAQEQEGEEGPGLWALWRAGDEISGQAPSQHALPRLLCPLCSIPICKRQTLLRTLQGAVRCRWSPGLALCPPSLVPNRASVIVSGAVGSLALAYAGLGGAQ